MHKIYINNRALIFIDKKELLDAESEKLCISYKSINTIEQAIRQLEEGKKPAIFIYTPNIETTVEEFVSLHTTIEAAGGLVRNSENKILFIYRLDKWDLPKGKLENNESPEEAAIREVEEECGISNLITILELDSTYHTYMQNEQRMLKRTYWFEMYYAGEQKLKPQLNESITDAQWIDMEEIDHIVNPDTYPSIIDVVDNLF
jgi:ADP-ribose pyrophosphatase YjhB (NUDIX family)